MLSARLVPIRRKWANVRGCEQALTVNQIQGRRDAVLVSVATVRRNSTALNQHTECSGQMRPFRSKKWHVESPEATGAVIGRIERCGSWFGNRATNRLVC